MVPGSAARRVVLATVWGLALSGAGALGADAPATDAPAATTLGEPTLATGELQLLCLPLTQAELKLEADGWLALLQAKVRELSMAEIAAGRASDAEAKDAALELAGKLREQRTQLIDRLNVVLAAYKAKGGKPEEYETYINAVSGIILKVDDAGAAYKTVLNWLKSPEGGLRYARNILLFLGTLLVSHVVARLAASIVGRTMGAFKQTSQLLRDFATNTTRKVIFFIGFVAALSMLEVNIGPFLAAIGAIGFVIGFALQGTLSNFAAGVMILLYRPYDLGNEVTLAGVTGRVEAMSLVSTVVRNKDGHTVTIPNSSIWGGTITNLSANTTTTNTSASA